MSEKEEMSYHDGVRRFTRKEGTPTYPFDVTFAKLLIVPDTPVTYFVR